MQTAPPQMATHDVEGELSWAHPSIKAAVCNVAPVQYTSHTDQLLQYKKTRCCVRAEQIKRLDYTLCE